MKSLVSALALVTCFVFTLSACSGYSPAPPTAGSGSGNTDSGSNGDTGGGGSDNGGSGEDNTDEGGTGNGGTGPATPPSNATLSWLAPTAREDGKTLATSELGEYRLYWSKDAIVTKASPFVALAPQTLSYTFTDLAPGTYYFAITAVDTNDLESQLSTVVTKTLQ